MLLDSRVELEASFGVTAWDAYWAVLHGAFRRGASPLELVQALVRGSGRKSSREQWRREHPELAN